MSVEVTREDPEEAWRFLPRHAADVRCAVSAGRLAWNLYGREAECPYPEGDALKKAWGRGYNAARHGWSLNEADIVRAFRARREIVA